MRYLISTLILTVCLALQNCQNQNPAAGSVEQLVFKINQKCPQLVDSETRLDGIAFVNKNTLVYSYSLVHVSAFAIDTVQFYKNMWPGILSTIRVSPDLQKLREQKLNVVYRYMDAYNKHIYTFRVGPEDYQ